MGHFRTYMYSRTNIFFGIDARVMRPALLIQVVITYDHSLLSEAALYPSGLSIRNNYSTLEQTSYVNS